MPAGQAPVSAVGSPRSFALGPRRLVRLWRPRQESTPARSAVTAQGGSQIATNGGIAGGEGAVGVVHGVGAYLWWGVVTTLYFRGLREISPWELLAWRVLGGLPVLVAQQLRAHHWRERQRDEPRHRDRRGDRQRKLREQPPGVARCERERHENRDERYGHRHHGKRDLARPAEGRL